MYEHEWIPWFFFFVFMIKEIRDFKLAWLLSLSKRQQHVVPLVSLFCKALNFLVLNTKSKKGKECASALLVLFRI